MKLYKVIILFTFISSTYLSSRPAELIDPQMIARQKEQREKAEKTGYGDIEIDQLHKQIAELLPRIKDAFEKPSKDGAHADENKDNGPDGSHLIKLRLGFGEYIKSISERYLYNSEVLLHTNEEGSQLIKVEMIFTRVNNLGEKLNEERRTLINPSPNFSEDAKQADRNDDFILIFAEKTSINLDDLNEKGGFEEKKRFILKDLSDFSLKQNIVETYKKYLRRGYKELDDKIYRRELARRHKVRQMLEIH